MKKWAIITGASSGIGEEFACQLYDMGYSILLIAKTPEKLTSVKNKLLRRKRPAKDRQQAVEAVAADLSRGDGCDRAFRTIESICAGRSDDKPAILINSAGFGALGEFKELPIDEQEKMIDVNVNGLVYLTHHMIQLMEKKGGGRILNVASSAALLPGGPYMAVYYATKSFVYSFTNGVRRELKERKSPVHLSVLCPGPVNTPFNTTAHVRNALPGISPRHCVRTAIAGMKKDRAVILPGLSTGFVSLGAKLLPETLLISLTGHQQKRKI